MTLPSASVARSKMPPGSPLRSGPNVSVMRSPGLNVRFVKPERVSTPGLDISIDHVFAASAAPGERSMTVSCECGFTQRNSTTSAAIESGAPRSYMLVEWCALAGAALSITIDKTMRFIESATDRHAAVIGGPYALEYRIAVLVGALDEVALHALPFDDVEELAASADPASGRRPRLGEHLGRRDRELDDERVGLREAHALDDVHAAVVRDADALVEGDVSLRNDADGVDDECVAVPAP